MSHASKIIKSSLSVTELRSGPDSLTKPGVYWFQRDAISRALMVEVRMTDGELTVWWPNEDQPVTNLKGHWRGPIPPSTAPGSR